MNASSYRRIAIGAMSGTSMDGVDVALVEIIGTGLSLQARLLTHKATPLGDSLSSRLRLAAEQSPMLAGEMASLAMDLGTLYAQACKEVTKDVTLQLPISLASLHGQTIFHKPPLTFQLINAQPVAQSLGCDIVFDLRAGDVFAGGEGAPLTPLADYILFRKKGIRRAVINFGGFANVTFLPPDDDIKKVSGGDVCACNQVLDCCSRNVLNEPFDMNGAAAERGMVDDKALKDLLNLFKTASGDGVSGSRSLGTGDELMEWVNEHRVRILNPDDLLATAAQGIGSFIGNFIRDKADEAIIAGGGTMNVRLVKAVTQSSGLNVLSSASLGVPAAAREATCWAILGCLAQDGLDVALQAVTHTKKASKHISGTWILQKKGVL